MFIFKAVLSNCIAFQIIDSSTSLGVKKQNTSLTSAGCYLVHDGDLKGLKVL